MLGLKQTLTFITSSIIIFWVRINQKIFCAGKILQTLNILWGELLLMMGRCCIIVIDLELSELSVFFICAYRIRKRITDLYALSVILPMSMYLTIHCFMLCSIFFRGHCFRSL